MDVRNTVTQTVLSNLAQPLAVFLHPGLAMAGLALAALPIIIHLLNRRRFRTVQWAAMDFLLQALRRNRRRIRFESWLLLATRCMLIGILGLALARPTGCADTALARMAGRDSGLHVFIIDDSASMSYRHERGDSATHFDHARRLAGRHLERLDTGVHQAALIAAAAPARAVVSSPTFDLISVSGALNAMQQTSRATDLAGALEHAVRIAEEEPAAGAMTLYILTDGTESGLGTGGERLANAARAAADHYRIVWHDLAAPRQSNRAVLEVRPADALLRSGFDAEFVTTVRGFGPQPGDALLAWRLDGDEVGATQAVSPSAEPETLSNADPGIESGLADGRPRVLSVSMIGSDNLPADDTRWAVVEQVRQMPVLLVEGRRDLGTLGASGALLSVALDPTRGRGDGYVQVETISDLELAGRALDGYRAVILAGVGSMTSATAEGLADYVRGGGVLMTWMGESVAGENYNTTLLPRGLLPGPLVRRVQAPGDDVIRLDFDPTNVHRYLSAFRGAQRSGLETAAVIQYWQIDLPGDGEAEAVLRWVPQAPGSPGDPAFVTHRLGAGRVLTATTAAGDPEWTLLPLKDNFAALIHELLSSAVGESDGGVAWMTLEAGQRLVPPTALDLPGSPQLIAPDGSVHPLQQEVEEGASRWGSDPLDQVGVWTLEAGERRWPIAVNLPRQESDVRSLEAAAVRAALGDVELIQLGDDLPDAAEGREDRRDFGWVLLLAVLMLACFECFLAMHFGRSRRGPGEKVS